MTAFFEVAGLTRNFGGLQAVSDLSFTLDESEMLAIVGPNGCGKTTLFNLVSGALRPSAGRILYRGTDIAGLEPQAIAALGLKRKFQVPSVFAEMTVGENLALAGLGGLRPGGPVALLGNGKPLGGSDIAGHLELCGLVDRVSAPAGDLSHGERQRLEIAMVVAGRARLLLLDEPTAGMTLGESQSVAEMLRGLIVPGGPSIIVIEHDMQVVRALECKVAVMDRGRFLTTGSYEEVSADPAVREAYLGPVESAATC